MKIESNFSEDGMEGCITITPESDKDIFQLENLVTATFGPESIKKRKEYMEKLITLKLTRKELGRLALILFEKHTKDKEEYTEHKKFYEKELKDPTEYCMINYQEYGQMLRYEKESLEKLDTVLQKIIMAEEKEESEL